MLDFLGSKNARPDSKIFTTLGTLPSYIDRSQPPTKKLPWRAINEVGFVKSVEMFLPEELYEVIWRKVEEELRPVKYAKVIMKLEDVLDGQFFTEYVKRGNILLLSEGQPGVDNVFSLRDVKLGIRNSIVTELIVTSVNLGLVRLELDKEAYERAGLQGHPCRGGSRKHVKARYVVEVNLRLPSMLHGKKGFERVVWAAKNVLNRSLTWLFYDRRAGDESVPEGIASPLSKHHPTIVNLNPTRKYNPSLLVPPLMPGNVGESHSSSDTEEWSQDVVEWLGLVSLESGRVQDNDSVDPYLCRYALPAGTNEYATPIRMLRWKGMVDSDWITQLLISCIYQTKVLPVNPSSTWLALTALAHPIAALNTTEGYSIVLTHAANETEAEPSISVSKEPAERAESFQVGIEDGMKGDPQGRRGLQNFACFQYSDTLVAY